MAHPITVVDSFTDTPFSGNPAGVCVLTGATTEAWMQSVAAELNLAETAFLVRRPDGDHDLRWFTPATEVDLCGHATLASAHVLGGERRFHTRSGVLTCRPGGDGAITMDFPAIPVTPVEMPVVGDWAARSAAGGEGRTSFVGEQVSARGGVVGMRLDGERVVLSGRAVTVIDGTLHSDPAPA